MDTLTAQLAALGYAAADVGTAILSHLHQDHIGGLPELGGAEIMVSAAEWAELSRPAPELRGFLRQHIELPGLKWRQVRMEPARDGSVAPFTASLDVMGDGRGQLPGVGNRRKLAASTRQVLALAERLAGLVILPAHDPGAAARLREA